MANRRSPRRQTNDHLPPPQQSGSMGYGAGHREAHETQAGREYYESGVLHREWVTSRRVSESDPRLFARREPPWAVRAYRRLMRWVTESVLVAPGLALVLGGVWAAWTLRGAAWGVAAFAVVCLMVGWRT